MKKLLWLLISLLIIILVLPLYLYWQLLATTALVSPSLSLNHRQLTAVSQLIQQHRNNLANNRLQLSEAELNQLLDYGSQKFSLPIATQTTLGQQQLQLTISLDTGLPLRRYLNIQLAADIEEKTPIITSGQIGALPLNQQQLNLLIDTLWPYLEKHPQYPPSYRVWQSIKAIYIQRKTLTIDFIIDRALQAEIQQQQLEFIVGKSALERLPFYQNAIEQQFASDLGKRIKLYRVMRQLFALSESQQTEMADPIADNKAIILALLLHTIAPQDFALLALNDNIKLPAKPLLFTIERKEDLAQHFLSTATLTLFANSELADAVGLYKELQDQQSYSGFSVRDLIANRAGSMLASELLSTPSRAKALQAKLAKIDNERAFFPASSSINNELEALLGSDRSGEDLFSEIDRRIDQHIRSAPIYQPLSAAAPGDQ